MDGLAIHAPQVVERVHRSFLDAGCDVIETCTFQATRPRLEEWGQGDATIDLNVSAARLARRIADEYSAGRPSALRRRQHGADRVPARIE